MSLQVVGAGLPRTGTASLVIALERLLGGRCYHMSVISGHPFDLGPDWVLAMAGGKPDWDEVFDGFAAAVDWPASMFWQELSEEYPDALVLLSTRDNADTWWHSCDETFLPFARLALDPGWKEGRGLTELLERFTGTKEWDDQNSMMAAYERHNDLVRKTIPSNRLLDWNATMGWEPICSALNLPVPEVPFPWVNRRSEWSK